MEGEGILRQVNGTKFKGSFHKGMKDGYGIMEDAAGNRFEGNFRENVKDGSFVEKDRSGRVIRKGIYRNGQLTN